MPEAEYDSVMNPVEEELYRTVPRDKPKGSLYHYTSAAGFRGIVEGGHLWATHYGFLSDTQELVEGESNIRGAASQLCGALPPGGLRRFLVERFLETYEENCLSRVAHACVASFCERGDQLTQWQAYAAGGGGYSVGFRPSSFRVPVPSQSTRPGPDQMDLWLVRCIYNRGAVKIAARRMLTDLAARFEAHMGRVRKRPQFRSPITGRFLGEAFRRSAAVALRAKHTAFRQEREWRLIALPEIGEEGQFIKFRETPRGHVPYVELDLRGAEGRLGISRVFVGPTQDRDQGLATAELYLSSHGYYGRGLARSSSLPLRGGT